MSMFTPVGMGGRSPGRPRRGRRLVAVLVVLVLVVAVGGAAWWWWTQSSATTPGTSAAPTPVCTTPTPRVPKTLPAPSDIAVEVLNGTSRSGLATDTADAFVLAGFDVVAFGNASKGADGVAVVSYAKADTASAVVVASYVPGATLVVAKGSTGGVVTVTLGPQFSGVATEQEAARAVADVQLPAGAPRCTTPAGSP